MISISRHLVALIALLSLADPPALADAQYNWELCGDASGVVQVPEITLRVRDADHTVVTPAYAEAKLSDGKRTRVGIYEDTLRPGLDVRERWKTVSLPLRVGADGASYILGPAKIELKNKRSGFMGLGKACNAWIDSIDVYTNVYPWTEKMDRQPVVPDFDHYRMDLTNQQITVLEDAKTSLPLERYRQSSTKWIANVRAKLEKLGREGLDVPARRAEKVEGSALAIEASHWVSPGLLTSDGGYWTAHARNPNDSFARCLWFAVLDHKPITVYGAAVPWPQKSSSINLPDAGFLSFRTPGSLGVSGIDAETWKSCQADLAAGRPIPSDPQGQVQVSEVTSFVPPATSQARAAAVIRPNLWGTYVLSYEDHQLYVELADEVLPLIPELTPRLDYRLDVGLPCLIEIAKKGGSAPLSAFKTRDAAGKPFVQLIDVGARVCDH